MVRPAVAEWSDYRQSPELPAFCSARLKTPEAILDNFVSSNQSGLFSLLETEVYVTDNAVTQATLTYLVGAVQQSVRQMANGHRWLQFPEGQLEAGQFRKGTQ
jgi:hypothetical protein